MFYCLHNVYVLHVYVLMLRNTDDDDDDDAHLSMMLCCILHKCGLCRLYLGNLDDEEPSVCRLTTLTRFKGCASVRIDHFHFSATVRPEVMVSLHYVCTHIYNLHF